MSLIGRVAVESPIINSETLQSLTPVIPQHIKDMEIMYCLTNTEVVDVIPNILYHIHLNECIKVISAYLKHYFHDKYCRINDK